MTLRRLLPAAAACGLAFACVDARATLGEAGTSAEADRARVGGERRVAQATSAQLRVHVITRADGSTIKEFETPAGVVFAISWSTRLKPRLDALLGAHAADYAQATRQALAAPGVRHQLRIAQGDLVVQASAHLDAHVGLAYLRSLVPPGVRVDELR
ncbi:MAG: DUF2844 domain-containing protein [Burkholderiaceae bacterium]